MITKQEMSRKIGEVVINEAGGMDAIKKLKNASCKVVNLRLAICREGDKITVYDLSD